MTSTAPSVRSSTIASSVKPKRMSTESAVPVPVVLGKNYCPELDGWTLDELPQLTQTIFRGALCLDGIGFPADADPSTRALEPMPPMLKLHGTTYTWSQSNKHVTTLKELPTGACASSHGLGGVVAAADLVGDAASVDTSPGRRLSPERSAVDLSLYTKHTPRTDPTAFTSERYWRSSLACDCIRWGVPPNDGSVVALELTRSYSQISREGTLTVGASQVAPDGAAGADQAPLPPSLRALCTRRYDAAHKLFLEWEASGTQSMPVHKLASALQKHFPDEATFDDEQRAMLARCAPLSLRHAAGSGALKPGGSIVDLPRLWRRMHNHASAERSTYIRRTVSAAKALEAHGTASAATASPARVRVQAAASQRTLSLK